MLLTSNAEGIKRLSRAHWDKLFFAWVLCEHFEEKSWLAVANEVDYFNILLEGSAMKGIWYANPFNDFAQWS